MQSGRLGPYEIDTVLGRGGMGTVYRAMLLEARHGLTAGAPVALKIVHPHLLESTAIRERFRREARIGQHVTHPNVVRAYGLESIREDGQDHAVLVMEYVEGQSLRAVLKEAGPTSEALARQIARALAAGLAAIHAEGAVHRDLKPENVLLTAAHEVKIMDLGVAHLQDELFRLTQADGFAGSVEYAAPEQFVGTESRPDGRSDLFSLGVVLYELVTGVHPFQAPGPRQALRRILDEEPRKAGEVNPQVSPFFEEILATLLARQKGSRFPSAEALALALDQGEAGPWWVDRAGLLRQSRHRPLRKIEVPHETGMFGRNAEHDLLRAAFDRAGAGAGQVVLLRGEAGIGKTRLVSEFVRRLGQNGEDPDVLLGTYAPGCVTTIAGAFSTAFGEHLGAEHLDEALGELFSEDWYLLPAFSALLSGAPLPPGAQGLTPELMHAAFASITHQLSKQRPLVIVIDDLHNAPEEGRSLFAALAHAIQSQRVMLVGCGRRQLPAVWVAAMSAMPHVQQLELERLGSTDLQHLLFDALGAQRLVRDLQPTIALKSGGNPFFALEILRSLRDKGRIERRPDGAWTTTGRADVIEVPSSLHDLIQARLTGLGDSERELLEVAACCGFEFDPLLVADVASAERIPALRALGRIEADHRLVRARGRSFVFDHHQLMEVLYASLPPLLREEYHGAITREFEGRLEAEQGEGAQGGLALEISRHGLRSAHPAAALPHLDVALDHLAQGHYRAEALRLMEEVLETPGLVDGEQRFTLLLRLNGALGLAGRREDQEGVLAEAERLAEGLAQDDLRARMSHARAHWEFNQGRLEEGKRHFASLLTMARALDDPVQEARAESGLGLVAYRQARFEDAQSHFRRNHTLFHEAGLRSPAASAMGNLGIVFQALGRHEEALDCLQQVLATAQEMGDRQLEGKCCDNHGVLLQSIGRVEEAKKSYARAVELAEQVGDRMSQAVGRVNLGSLLRAQDCLAEAMECLETALAIGVEIGDPINQAISLDNLGAALRVLGCHAAARERHEAALALCRKVGSKRDEGYVLENLGLLCEDEGRLADAADFLEGAVALRREIKYVIGEVSALAGLARVVARQGDEERGTRLLDQAIELSSEHASATELLRARIGRARLPGGSVEDGLEALAEYEDRVDREDAIRALFVMWEVTGDEHLLGRARRLLDERIANAPAARRDTMRERVPLHREILAACGET